MNISERAVVMSETEVIDLQDLAAEVLQRSEETYEASPAWPKQMSLEQNSKIQIYFCANP